MGHFAFTYYLDRNTYMVKNLNLATNTMKLNFNSYIYLYEIWDMMKVYSNNKICCRTIKYNNAYNI